MPPLITLTLIFAAGIITAVHLALPVPLWLGTAGAIFIIGFYCLLARRRQGLILTLLLLTFLLGGLRAGLALLPEQTLAPFVGSEVLLEGVLVGEPQATASGSSYILKTRLAGRGEELTTVKGLVIVFDRRPLQEIEYSYGDLLRVKGTLLRPRPAANFGQFDYRAYLERRGIRYSLNVSPAGGPQKLGSGTGNVYLARLLSWRQRFVEIADNLAPEDAALLKGITLGERRGISAETIDLFTTSGTVHLLAVSGVHVGLVAALALGMARLLRLPFFLQTLVSAAAVTCYAAWTGFSASAMRAGVMFLLGLLGFATGRPKNAIVALSGAAFLLLCLNPMHLYDTSFQLSFAAAGGILWLAPCLMERFKGGRATWLWSPLIVSLAAQLAVWPLTAYYFSGVSLVGFLASLVAIPLAGWALGLGLMGLLSGAAFLPLGKVFLGAAAVLLRLLTYSADIFSRLPLAFVYMKQPPLLFLVPYYLALVGLPWTFQHSAKWSPLRRRAAVCAVLLILGLGWRGTGLVPQQLTVDFLSVGQGDAILIRSPSGQAALIDAGPRQAFGDRVYDAGESIVLPYLRSQGVHRLEILFLTHGDMDHAGGAPAVLTGLPVGAVIAPPNFAKEGPPLILSLLKERGLPLYSGSRGLKVDLGAGVEFVVYSPPEEPIVSASYENDNSLVIGVHYGDNSFLFMGDAGGRAEELLLRHGVLFDTDVLKVAHHGAASATGSEFLNVVQPELAVISVGNNNFGHPNPETVGRLFSSGATVLRTDQVGQVRVLADGERLRVMTRAGGIGGKGVRP
jgi:competence protein ComEC